MIETLICKAFRIKAAHTVSKFQLGNDLFINFFFCERRVGRFLFLQADDISCCLVIKFFFFFLGWM